jgi:hypothetical protein
MARDLGITQKSAWFLTTVSLRLVLWNLRENYPANAKQDETFIGGNARIYADRDSVKRLDHWNWGLRTRFR